MLNQAVHVSDLQSSRDDGEVSGRTRIEDHFPLVSKVLGHILSSRGVSVPPRDYEDLEQAGRLGLVEAYRNYDSSRAKFSTYAWACIQFRINEQLQLIFKSARCLELKDVQSRYSVAPGFEQRDLVRSILAVLTEQEKLVIELYYLEEDATLSSVAKKLSRTPSWVWFVKERALTNARAIILDF